ncbi:hypothetical protein EWM64_g3106 [Hericium alpestre]|uniref:SH3 domain-containing protein n=1 Tax=Hericium alpestre TaxID=135208 RepID=A0A4Z0A2F3_9AGAM|nr:hypothetical protein EWM64_g3106 [Hericium alpestre]
MSAETGIHRPSLGPLRQDTFDLRDQIITDEGQVVHGQGSDTYPSDEEHSVLEDDSDGEERDANYIDDDDRSSSLSIPNESIDFDLVYSLHSFAATVEGQASVVKGDSLVLMDDSNSYWWLVRVLKTQEIGYIPAENIETPFERLARLNKHRNVDLASATQAEMQDGLQESRDHFRNNMSSRNGSHQQTPSPTPGNASQVVRAGRSRQTRSVIFTASLMVHRYPPAVWGDEEEEDEDVEWDTEPYEDEDPSLVDQPGEGHHMGMESDDGMSWEEALPGRGQAQSQGPVPEVLRPGLLSPEQPKLELQTEQQQQEAQRQQVEEQQRRQQQQQLIAQQQQVQQRQQQQQQQRGNVPPTLTLHHSGSRERLDIVRTSPSSISPTSPGRVQLDPAEAVETRKISVTPNVARESGGSPQRPNPTVANGPLLPSAVMQRQEDDRKRTREEIEALEEAARKKAKGGKPGSDTSPISVRGPQAQGPAKLHKSRDSGDEDSGKDKDKKGRSGLFGGLFGRKKDKHKEKGSSGSIDVGSSVEVGRSSEESGKSSNPQHGSVQSHADAGAPRPQQMMQQQQQPQQQPQQQAAYLAPPQTPPQQEAAARSNSQSPVSQHAVSLRQRDQEHQALYQQYLNRSPASPPEVQPSFGLQSASVIQSGSLSLSSSASSALGPPTEGRRPRPGSLVFTPNAIDGQGVGVPELSVIRVFAGKKLQTEATFKTVLLNNSTTSADLVRQAIQRFRLPAGEDANDYYLTVKQLEGSSAILRDEEKPLVVFETLVEAAMELPKVKRSSVGSISSIASNLSMHPAIKKLPMNDFTDDSAVKFYLNRKGENGMDDSLTLDEGDVTLMAESVQGDDDPTSPGRPQYLTVSQQGASVSADRFMSPSFRFALKLVIYPDDLPEDMVFDPLTEAIVFKNTLRDRSQSSSSASSSISPAFRRKIFVFPKNITVAEVIEIGLERFGISEGVVDGGDEVEDKLSKRRSSIRVRYALNVSIDGKERELPASSKIIDAYPRPPAYRAVDRRSSDSKRRSVDSMQLLGTMEDVQLDDPVFVLRRAVTYRASSSRHRLSAPLDEIALQHLHRESVSSSSATSDTTAGDEPKQRHMSKQELIAAQRAASRANQKAILSAQTNSMRGVDVLLPGNVRLRSSRYEVDDRMRYSYVQPGGETVDISDIVEEVWQGDVGSGSGAHSAKGDLLENALTTRDQTGLGEKLDRVLSKIKNSKAAARAALPEPPSTASTMDSIASAYSDRDEPHSARSVTPTSGQRNARSPTPTSPRMGTFTNAPRTTSPTAGLTSGSDSKGSIASVMSDTSGYRTAVGSPLENSPPVPYRSTSTPKPTRPRPVLPKDDFGVSHMMAIIEFAGIRDKTPPLPPLDPVDELLFGRQFNVNTLHPEVCEIYGSTLQQLEEMDKALDDLLPNAIDVST